ncbi:MAG: CPBP family glutamic-type intramembrane protease [Phycisphaerae bacterium]
MPVRSTRSTRTRSRKAGGSSTRGGTVSAQYWECAAQPLYSLAFLFPVVAAYEFGAIVLRPVAWPEKLLVAQNLLHVMLGMLGATGLWMPGLALLLTLLTWHILSRHRWSLHAWVLPLMLAECLLLTLPLFVIGRILLQAGGGGGDFRVNVVLALGAAIYEELLFRLGLIVLLSVVLVDLLRVPKRFAAGPIVVASALLFAAAHFAPLGSLAYSSSRFAILAVSGAYLSGVFLLRGLGVCTGCHAAYNVLLLVLH